MKKEHQKITLLNSDAVSNNVLKENSFKTTNVNILLNRVRLDKKRILKKRIIITFCLVITVTSVIAYLII